MVEHQDKDKIEKMQCQLELLEIQMKELKYELGKEKNKPKDWFNTQHEKIFTLDQYSDSQIRISCNLGTWKEVKNGKVEENILFLEIRDKYESVIKSLDLEQMQDIYQYLHQVIDYLQMDEEKANEFFE